MDTRVIFMGSPSEVLKPLAALYEAGKSRGLTLAGIVSQPARPAGRGAKLVDPPVAIFAKERNIETLQPESARDQDFLDVIRRMKPDVIVTAAYGQILSEEFLKIPRIGTINIHPSLLPAYRGATPVPAALLDGCKVTGVSILFTVKKLDAGNIILQKAFVIGAEETSGALTERLFAESGPMLLDALDILVKDPATQGLPQVESDATFCRKISKEMGQIDWSQSAQTIFNRHRAFQPWPGSYTNFGDRVVVITEMGLADSNTRNARYGTFAYDKPLKSVVVSCGSGVIHIRRLKPAGGKDMDAASFWNGLKDREALFFGEMR